MGVPGAVGVIEDLWRGAGIGWPGLQHQRVWVWGDQGLWQIQRLLLVGYLGLALSQQQGAGPWGPGAWGWVVSSASPMQAPVAVARQADGRYEATLSGSTSR